MTLTNGKLFTKTVKIKLTIYNLMQMNIKNKMLSISKYNTSTLNL